MADYYVSATRGSASGDGSYDNPFLTIQEASDAIATPSTIHVEAGTYIEEIWLSNGGTDDSNRIIIQGERGSNGEFLTIIDGNNTKETLLSTNGMSYLTIQDIKFQNIKKNWGSGVAISDGSTYVTVKNCEICNINTVKTANGANPIIVYSASTAEISHVLLDSLHVHDCTLGWCESISVAGNVQYVDVINCEVHDNTNIGIDFCDAYDDMPSNPEIAFPRHCRAIGNKVYNCVSTIETSYGLYTDGGQDILFDRNIVYGCGGGIEVGSEKSQGKTYPCKDVVVMNNLVYNCNEIGVQVGAYDTTCGMVQDVKIYNNTIVGSGTYSFSPSICNNVDVRNNIFTQSNTEYMIYNEFDTSATQNLMLKNNLWYNADSSFTKDTVTFYLNNAEVVGFDNYVTAWGEVNSQYADADLENDYTLKSTSPCINAGDDSVDVGEMDLAGNTRKIGIIDIGCYEVQSQPEPEDTIKCYIGLIPVAKGYLGLLNISNNF